MISIPVASCDVAGNEEKYVLDAIRSTWISSTGPYITRFEKELAAACGARAAVGVCNGTVGLHLALAALGVGPGDEVLVPSLTYIATANAVRYVGAEPVFVDVDPATWCIDPTRLREAVTPRTRGLVPVHLYGHPADMDAIQQVASAHGLWVVEDAAEAHFATYKGRPVGSLSRVAVFSFYGNKVLTCGEGGALTLDDPALEERARMLRGQGMDPRRRYYFPVTGFNYRLTNVAAAMLCAQLERREAILARRRRVFRLYRELLQDVAGIGFQPCAPWAEPTPWLFCVTVDQNAFGRSRDELMAALLERGIDTRPFFLPVHQLPPFREASRRRGEDLPVTVALAASGLNLPTYNDLRDSDVERVAEAVREARP
jgi:perosamine synthetase